MTHIETAIKATAGALADAIDAARRQGREDIVQLLLMAGEMLADAWEKSTTEHVN